MTTNAAPDGALLDLATRLGLGSSGLWAPRILGVNARTWRAWVQGRQRAPRAAVRILEALAGLDPELAPRVNQAAFAAVEASDG